MHKKTLKRSTFNSLQKIKAPAHLLRIQDSQNSYNDSSNHFQLPSLSRKKSWKDFDNSPSSWDRNSTATSMSWSPEMEDIATWKIVQQWEAVERTLYDENEQVSQTPILEECVQWRTQMPHLRIVGKNSSLSAKDKFRDLSISYNPLQSNLDSQNEDTVLERTVSGKERKSSSNQKSHRTAQDNVFQIIFEYVISELFPNKENEVDSLHEDLNDILRIRQAPVYSNKSSAKSFRVNWVEDTSPPDDRFSISKMSMKKEANGTNLQGIQMKYEDQVDGNKAQSSKGGRDNMSLADEKLYRQQTARNKLGTVFNEKIVVSPVPYVLSTRESFSTLRTTPIKFMGQYSEVSTQGSGRNIYGFRNSAKKSTAMRISNGQSAWHAPVSPAVWPKNIKLAPIDTSQLPSSKNKSVAPSSVVLQRNRKPLSPISRSTLPVSAHSVRNNNNEILQIQGKHIVPGQSPKLGLPSAGSNYSPKISRNRKKKNRVNNEI